MQESHSTTETFGFQYDITLWDLPDRDAWLVQWVGPYYLGGCV